MAEASAEAPQKEIGDQVDMIRNVKVIFCDNEHVFGEVTFPRVDELTEQDFISPRSAKQLRAEAKKAGWTAIRKSGDYCDACSAEDQS